jgi:hypothetical protein
LCVLVRILSRKKSEEGSVREIKKFVEIGFCLYWQKNKAVKIFFSTISFDIRCPAQKNFIGSTLVRKVIFLNG